jgi:hypothetical protein
MDKKKTVQAHKPEIPAQPGFVEKNFGKLAIVALAVVPLILYGRFLTGSVMLYGSDFIGSAGYVSRKFMADYIAQHGQFALWLPYIYSGLPTAAAFFGDIFYPLTILLRMIMAVHVAWTYTFVIHVFLAGLGTYLFLKEWKVPVYGAFLLAVAYMLAGSVVSTTHEGHDGRLICTTLLPLVMFFLERGLNTKRFIFFLLCGTMMGMQLLSGHLQEMYYTGLTVVIYFLYRLFIDYKDHRNLAQSGKLVGYMAATLLFTGCLVAVQYLPIYGNAANGVRGASRGYQFATSWAMGPEETFDLVTARFTGGLDHYWGRNPFKSHTEYLGILPLILALIGIIYTWRERNTKFFFWLLMFILLMAWGGHTPFYYIPYYLFPGVAKFRAPALIFFVGAFSIIVLAGAGIKYLLTGHRASAEEHGASAGGRGPKRAPRSSHNLTRFLAWTAGVGAGLLLIAAIAQGPITAILRSIPGTKPDEISANYGNFLGGMAIAAVLILVNVGLVYALITRRMRPLHFCLAAALALFVDMWIVDSKYIMAYPPPAQSFAPDEAITYLQSQNESQPYRVFPLYYVDQSTGMSKSDEGLLMYYGIQSVAGEHPNPLQNYMDYLGLGNTVMTQFPPNLMQRRFLDLLNTKYIISVPLPEDASKYAQDAQQSIRMLKQYVNQPGITLVHQTQDVAIYRNDSLLPRAFLVPDYQVLKDKDALLARLKAPDFDPRRTVLLSDEPAGAAHPNSTDSLGMGEVTLKSYDANRIVVEATTTKPGFLVLSETYYPDWKAWDNGTQVKIDRAYLTLRAVYLEPGTHTIEFKYDSKYLKSGLLLSLLALAFLAITGGVSLVGAHRRRIAPPPGSKQPVSTNPV